MNTQSCLFILGDKKNVFDIIIVNQIIKNKDSVKIKKVMMPNISLFQ